FLAEPVIFVVDDDPQVLAAIRRDLRSRYRADYRVLAANSGEAALDAVKELKARGDTLAMLISDQRMPAMLGVDLLTRCREIYPVARRVLLTAYSDVKAAVRAINEAHLDHYFEKPWDPPEEHLFPAIDELLAAWQAEYRPEVTGLRLVGHQWSPRSHQVKDFLASNLIPYRWLDVERDPDARQLLEASGVAPHELPTLLLENGRALRNPDRQQLAENLGLATSAAHELYDLVIVGAGPAGLAAAVYGAYEGLPISRAQASITGLQSRKLIPAGNAAWWSSAAATPLDRVQCTCPVSPLRLLLLFAAAAWRKRCRAT